MEHQENIVLPASMSNEELGNFVANESVGILNRLDALKPYFVELWKRFDALKDGETINGCKTRTEFCENILHRTRRSVQYILYGRPTRLPSPESVRCGTGDAVLDALIDQQNHIVRQIGEKGEKDDVDDADRVLLRKAASLEGAIIRHIWSQPKPHQGWPAPVQAIYHSPAAEEFRKRLAFILAG